MGVDVAIFETEKLTFTYAGEATPALRDVSLTVRRGEFVTLCGKSGSGKSTLMRNLSSEFVPGGKRFGNVFFMGRDLDYVPLDEQKRRIGYVFQDPERQILTDTVRSELSLGLESLGYDSRMIRLRIAEMSGYFGIHTWIRKDVASLSGGQKQMLNLAAAMSLQPDILILDEPTARLDPIAASEFLETVRKINIELGTTIILSEQRLEHVFPMCDRAVVLDAGSVIADAPPKRVGVLLAEYGHDMFAAMPTPMQVFMKVESDTSVKAARGGESFAPNVGFPITVKEGRDWLSGILRGTEISRGAIDRSASFVPRPSDPARAAVSLKDVHFRYERGDAEVMRGFSFDVPAGKITCILGANGVGKSTALKLMGGVLPPDRGRITVFGKRLDKLRPIDRVAQIGLLPQDPLTLFEEDTVEKTLLRASYEFRYADGSNPSPEDRQTRMEKTAALLETDRLLKRRPDELSGGELQKAGLAKLLLRSPDILLLDEPTKGMDGRFKERFAVALRAFSERGKTALLVSHDVEFCAKYADLCALFFDGEIVTTSEPGIFFSGNGFYTTAANRMSRHVFENAVTPRDIVTLCRANFTGT